MRRQQKGNTSAVRRSVVCTLHSALWLGRNRDWHSILPAIRALGVRAVECRERKQGATVVVVNGGGLERSAPVLSGILMAKSQVGSAPPQNLAEEGTVWKHWRLATAAGRDGDSGGVLPSDGHGRPLIHRGRACTGRLGGAAPPFFWGTSRRSMAFAIGQECCPAFFFSCDCPHPKSGLAAYKPDKHRYAPKPGTLGV